MVRGFRKLTVLVSLKLLPDWMIVVPVLQGYGLGLSIVSRIAYWFGGEIQVDQSPTLGGARFIMIWPASRYGKKSSKTDRKLEKLKCQISQNKSLGEKNDT